MKSDIIRYATIVKNGLTKSSDTTPDPNSATGGSSGGAVDSAASNIDVPQIKSETIFSPSFLVKAFDYFHPLIPLAAAALGYSRDGIYGAVRAGTMSSGALLGLLSSLYSMRNLDQSSGYFLPVLRTLLSTAASAYIADLVGRPAAEYYSYKRDRGLMTRLRDKLINEGYDPSSREMVIDEEVKAIKKKIKPKNSKKKASYDGDTELRSLIKSVISALESR